jgi:oxalate decarboxylase/phosphoglucose isomerase-like protein (cupin superfamily)
MLCDACIARYARLFLMSIAERMAVSSRHLTRWDDPVQEDPDMAMTHIKPAQTETFSFEWGTMKWFVSPVTIPGAANSQGEVIINPGQGHVRHLHEHADELIYVISGTGTQTVGDEEFPVTEGDVVYIPMATLTSPGTRRARSSAGSDPRTDL